MAKARAVRREGISTVCALPEAAASPILP
jgi:hypothetical protein